MNENKIKVIMLGAGSTGSYVGKALTHLIKNEKISLTVCDFDTVENHNTQNQIYRKGDIGKLKVTALAEILSEENGVNITPEKEDPKNFITYDIIINAIDDIEARKKCYKKYCNAKKIKEKMIYIETGTGFNNHTVWYNEDMKKIHQEMKNHNKELHKSACGAILYNTASVMNCAGAVGMIIDDIVESEQLPMSFTQIKDGYYTVTNIGKL